MSDARRAASKQSFTTENIEDHGDHEAVRILGASRGRAIERRAKRHYSVLRGPPVFSVLKTCLSCRSTEAERAITTVRPGVQDRLDAMCDSCRAKLEDDDGEQNLSPWSLIWMQMGPGPAITCFAYRA